MLAKKYLANLILISLVIWLFLGNWYLPVQAATLQGASDFIDNDTPLAANVSHNITFFIPSSGHTIVPSDYIRITFTNFSAVTAATGGSGWTGAPAFSVNANTALITGINASPNTSIGISGITATNPASDFSVTIEVANDASGTIVYDSVTITAQSLKGTTTTSVTIAEPTSTLILNGFTSPNAFITFYLNDAVAGTTTANAAGDFSKTFSGLTPNISYEISITAQDTQLRYTEAVSFNVDTLPFISITVNNILLPTTISLTPNQVIRGETVTISGLAHPFSQITLFLDSSSAIVVGANDLGIWSYELATINLSLGLHAVAATEVAQGGYTSISTQTLNFVVLAPGTIIPTSTPIPGLTTTPEPSDLVNNPPQINIISPVAGGVLLPGNKIIIQLSDDQDIELTSIVVVVDGQEYTYGDPRLTISGQNGDYILIIAPTNLPLNKQLTLRVSANDLSGLNSQKQISFVFSFTTLPETGKTPLAAITHNDIVKVVGLIPISVAALATAISLLTSFTSYGTSLFNLLVFLGRKKQARVLDAQTHQPLSGAFIELYNSKEKLVQRVVSDLKGRYAIKTPKKGNYHLHVYAIDYKDTVFDVLARGKNRYIRKNLLISKKDFLTNSFWLKKYYQNQITHHLLLIILVSSSTTLSLLVYVFNSSFLHLLILIYNMCLIVVFVISTRYHKLKIADIKF